MLLDVGCGDGYLSEQLQRCGNQVVGFDNDLRLVAAARSRGLEVRHGNAEQLYFYQEFDAVLSYDALHWMQRSDQVAIGIYEALKPGGRFVGEFAGPDTRKSCGAHCAIHWRADPLTSKSPTSFTCPRPAPISGCWKTRGSM
ncbi:class I SAM-dependent methyltransferase [Pseudomonas sp. PCH446]